MNIIRQDNDVFAVAGELTFSGIDKKTIKSFDFLESANPITLDLSEVANTDSAGLALVIEWLKYAGSHQIELKFQNIPEQLLKLAKLSGLDQSGYFSIQG
ncbi:MAG: STAS domain-containing protein [Gammaproteobacteria bacterium]